MKVIQMIEPKLGFDKIRNKLLEYCDSELGRQHAQQMSWHTDKKKILSKLREVEEFILLQQQNTSIPTEHFYDKRTAVKRAQIPGAFLEEKDLYEVCLSMKAASACVNNVYNATEESYKYLREVCSNVSIDLVLVNNISAVFDDNGKVRDNATNELAAIRTGLIKHKQVLRSEIDRILKSSKQEGFTDSKSLPTLRNSRMVIPVKSEYKRKIKGLIHDESDSGQTTYLEPDQVFEANNRIRELESQERRELIRILSGLTEQIGAAAHDLLEIYTFLGYMDFIRAKASLAKEMDAVCPIIQDRPVVSWQEARHPLLLLSLGIKKTKPINVQLNDENRILVISGPNAGGKSVSLKTVGLLQYMLQCGLLVPVDKEESRFGVFRQLMADIGDEQSLEDELSTYSAHLASMHLFLKEADKKTLLLIDEFGTGTEPEYGGAIAETLLHEFNVKKSFGVITTHYSNLKNYARDNGGVVNGAMLFDNETMKPTYELEIGKPGSSFALEIARKIGMDDDFIKRAAQKVGKGKIDYDHEIRELEREKSAYQKERKELEATKKRLNESKEDYLELKKHLDRNRKSIILKAKTEGASLVAEANKEIEKTIRVIKESKANKRSVEQARNKLEKFNKGKLRVKQSEKPEPVEDQQEIKTIGGDLEIGCFAKVKDSDIWGEVVGMAGNDIEIQVGALRMHKKKKELVRVSKKEIKRESKSAQSGATMLNKSMNATSELDVRGDRAEEALQKVERFIDDALMAGLQQLRIVHGRGNGILRNVIRTTLKDYTQIHSLHDEHIERGGDGVTIVIMNE